MPQLRGPLIRPLIHRPKPPTLVSVQINPSTVNVITSTYYPDGNDPIQQVRAALATEAIRAFGFAGYSVTVIDGGSDQSILPLHELGARVLNVDDNDMVFVRQLAAATVIDRSPYLTHLVWTEPEKNIADQIGDWVERAIAEDAAVLVPMRKHMESYPLHQQVSERALNKDLAAVLNAELGDHVFGPRVFRRDAVIRHWLRDYDEYGTNHRQWAAITNPVFSALAAGDRVVGLPVDFEYPEIQSAIEDDETTMIAKRRIQRDVIVNATADIAESLTWDPDWNLELLDGFTLNSQTMSVIDLTDVSEPVAQHG